VGALGDTLWIRAVEWKVVSEKNSHHSGWEGRVQILEPVAYAEGRVKKALA